MGDINQRLAFLQLSAEHHDQAVKNLNSTIKDLCNTMTDFCDIVGILAKRINKLEDWATQTHSYSQDNIYVNHEIQRSIEEVNRPEAQFGTGDHY